MKRHVSHRFGLVLIASLLASCGGAEGPGPTVAGQVFPSAGKGKFDVFGRELAGVPAPYPADDDLRGRKEELASNMQVRRQVGWDIIERTIEPVPLLGLMDGNASEEVSLPDGSVPTVPRFQTWYGVNDIRRIFRHAFEQLTPLERLQRASFDTNIMDAAEEYNATYLDRSERWPLARFLNHVRALGICEDALSDEACGKLIQSKFSGATGGNSRIAYSPSAARHIIQNYAPLVGCLQTANGLTMDAVPTAPQTNFSHCFTDEFPTDSVLLKVHWVRADFGRTMPTYDTDADALKNRLAADKSADWSDGDRQSQPTEDEVFTIRLKNGDIYRLAALHVMTKELRHWTWVTLWWSDSPDTDFGADRPSTLIEKNPVWANYKMNIVVDYLEQDPEPASGFNDFPTLAAAISAVNLTTNDVTPTWASNPYIEHGQGNARTNCIGCHQHGGSQIGPDLNGDGEPDAFDLERVITDESLFPFNGRTELRSIFPADYLWSTQRIDSLSQLLRAEVERAEILDQDNPDVRAAKVLSLVPELDAGETTFSLSCTACHAKDGTGTPAGPNLHERVPSMTDTQIVSTLLSGRSPMPSWSQLPDQELANLRYYLRQTFGNTRSRR